MDINNIVCTCCLRSCTRLFNISSCKYSGLLRDILNKISMPLLNIYVCWLCHSSLKQMDMFKRQVETSCRLMLTNQIVSSEHITKQKLQFSDIRITSYSGDELKEDKEEIIEIKIEDINDMEDFDYCVEIKPEIEEKTHKKKKRKKNSKWTKSGKERVRKEKNLDPCKIRMIVLTHEEMMAERAKELHSEGFLKLPYKCKSCIIGFDYEQTLLDHMDRKHNLQHGDYVCDTCESVLSTQPSFSTHRRRHLLRFECVTCGKRTLDKDAMLKHYENIHENHVTMYICNDCGATSESYRAHRYHREKHKDKPQCANCGKTFTNKNSLRLHMLNMHLRERTFACDVCDKVYKGKSGLTMHMATHQEHNKMAAFCQVCKIQFKTVYGYNHHLKTNSKHITEDDKRFVCDECGGKFLTKRLLQEHVDWEHLKSSKHTCELCKMSFKRSVGLKKHRKFVHEKQRPPRNKMCHHCGRGFTTTAILRSHIRTHTGERPLQCTQCSAKFAHSAALYTHIKLLHSITNKI